MITNFVLVLFRALPSSLHYSRYSYMVYFSLCLNIALQAMLMTILHTSLVKKSKVIDSFEKVSETLLAWFRNNSIKAN